MKEQVKKYNEIRKTEGSKAANDFAAKFVYSLDLDTPAARGKIWAEFKAEEKAEAAAQERKEKAEKRAKTAKLKSICEAVLKSVSLSEYERKFLNDIKTKRKLTEKQANWLHDLAGKANVEIVGEIQIRGSRSTSVHHNCDHGDLGSLGYRHGEFVKCPHCGTMTEVW